MVIHQFYDKGLAHASYAIIREGKMIVIDPSRDPQPYYDFAVLHEADITGVIETHPHADFVSSHLEIYQTTGATIYASKLLGATYPHQTFDDGDVIELNDIQLRAINTPGHSPDSICVLVIDENGEETAVFTGDTLFVGDVGRPDLRENTGNTTAKKEELAAQMFDSTREKLMQLPENIVVYPAHGPGSLCGKNLSPELQSTIGREIRENYALAKMSKFEFVQLLINDQPFIPKYFEYDVELNKRGAPPYGDTINRVPRLTDIHLLKAHILVIDTRPQNEFTRGHITGAINLQDGEKFETWLGSVVAPGEKFYLIAGNEQALNTAIQKTARIGYESQIEGAGLAIQITGNVKSPELVIEDFERHPENHTIIDARNWNEIYADTIFDHSLPIPLPELRERLSEIPADKPIFVHCAAGYRSAAAASIIAGKITNVPVYNLGENILKFIKTAYRI
jgi:glyoxylase-like metal-dependent hydrolase (beta-lactamase superfamily II)/rhodanese-related sulfurtransferase